MKDIEELIEDQPPAVRIALKRALQVLEEDEPHNPRKDFEQLMKLGHYLQGGAPPPVAVLVGAVTGAIGLLRWVDAKRQSRINQSRRRGTAAGLAAYQASRLAGRRATKR